MKKLASNLVALTVILGLAGVAHADATKAAAKTAQKDTRTAAQKRAAADATLGDLVAAYSAKGEYVKAYCLLYAKLDKDPEDGQTRVRLETLQRSVYKNARSIKDKWALHATLGFYHYTAGDNANARKMWGVALKYKTKNPAVRERIERCLLQPIDSPSRGVIASAPSAEKPSVLDAPASLPEPGEFK